MATEYQMLKDKRNILLNKMEDISLRSQLDDNNRMNWDFYHKEVEQIDKRIDAMKLRNYNKNNDIPMNRKDIKQVIEFKDWMNRSIEDGTSEKFKIEFRADPILTSTDTGLILKSVSPKLDVLVSPNETFLRELGVLFLKDLNGTFKWPSMTEDTAAFVAENSAAASANMAPTSLTLNGRRLTHTQSITVETLAQAKPGFYQDILTNLINGIWNGITKDLFLNVTDSDCAGRKVSGGTVSLNQLMLVNMEASVGIYQNQNLKYVTTPVVRKYCKTTAKNVPALLTEPLWPDSNVVNGYPSYSHKDVSANSIIFGDFSKSTVGIWGNGIDIIVDPYSNAKTGVINLTAVCLCDTGVYNKNAFTILYDCSVGN